MINKIMPKVFYWMFLGLLLTFLTGYYVAAHPYTAAKILGGYKYIVLIIIEIILVIFLSSRITKMSPVTAKISFLAYSVISGITFCGIFLVYELSSVMYIFAITAILFGIFALIGQITKIDLTKISTYLVMTLLAVIICSIINIFLNNTLFDMIISIILIIVFLAFTAYDIQNIKKMSNYIPEDNLAIYGALQLYLDFINIFIELLNLFGKNNN